MWVQANPQAYRDLAERYRNGLKEVPATDKPV
jgi:hypothetical protein